MKCHAMLAVAILAVALAIVLKPAREWRVEGGTGRILLDAEELSKPKYPHLVRWLNGAARRWDDLRQLIRTDEAFLMRKAELDARSYLPEYFPEDGVENARLLGAQDGGASETLSLQGLRALLRDLDDVDANASFAKQSAFGRFATQQQIIKALSSRKWPHDYSMTRNRVLQSGDSKCGGPLLSLGRRAWLFYTVPSHIPQAVSAVLRRSSYRPTIQLKL